MRVHPAVRCAPQEPLPRGCTRNPTAPDDDALSDCPYNSVGNLPGTTLREAILQATSIPRDEA